MLNILCGPLVSFSRGIHFSKYRENRNFFYLLSDTTSFLSFPSSCPHSLLKRETGSSVLKLVFSSVQSIMFEKAVLALNCSCRCSQLEGTVLKASRMLSCSLWKWTTWNPKQFPRQFRVLSFTVSKVKKLFAWCLVSVAAWMRKQGSSFSCVIGQLFSATISVW